MGGRIALLVTADEYLDPGLANLRSPVHDANALARVLADPEVGDFQIKVVSNQPAHVVAGEIEATLSASSRGDVILLYFSCHGLKDDAGRLYFAMSNTIAARPASTTVPAAFVAQQLDDSRSQSIITLLDCCYSGAFSRGFSPRSSDQVDVGERLQGSGRVVITASTATEYAFEADSGSWRGEPSPSVFTSAVVRGLDSGAADLDGDGLITADELYNYVEAEVRRVTPKQTPSKASRVTGPLLVAKRRSRTLRGRDSTRQDDDVFAAARDESADVRASAIPALYKLGKRSDLEARRASLDWLGYLRRDQDVGVAFAADQALCAVTGVPVTARQEVARKRSLPEAKGPRGLVERVARSFTNPSSPTGLEAEFFDVDQSQLFLAEPEAGEAPGPLRLAEIGLKVPRNAADAMRLLIDRPPGWEYLYFGAIVHREMTRLESRWRDHQMRYVHRSDRVPVPQGQELVFLGNVMREASTIINIEGVLSPEMQARAFGLPGESGDPEMIEHLATRLVAVYRDQMSWAAMVRGAMVDEEFERLFALTAQLVDLPILQFRQFVDASLSRLDRISMLQTAEIPSYLPLELTITADDALLAAQRREMRRITR